MSVLGQVGPPGVSPVMVCMTWAEYRPTPCKLNLINQERIEDSIKMNKAVNGKTFSKCTAIP